MASLIVSADYMEGTDRAASSPGHQVLTEAMIGKNTMLALDCKACHKMDEKSVGPAYTDVAKKYQKDPNAVLISYKKYQRRNGSLGRSSYASTPDIKKKAMLNKS